MQAYEILFKVYAFLNLFNFCLFTVCIQKSSYLNPSSLKLSNKKMLYHTIKLRKKGTRKKLIVRSGLVPRNLRYRIPLNLSKFLDNRTDQVGLARALSLVGKTSHRK